MDKRNLYTNVDFEVRKRDLRFVRRETLGIVLAIVAISALQIFSFKLLQEQILRERDASTMVGASANQRMLSQRIALLSLALINVDSDSTRAKAKNALLSEVLALESNHQALIAGDPSRGISAEKSEMVREIFFSPKYALDATVREFIAAARSLVESDASQYNVTNPTLYRITELSTTLSQLFDRLTTQYRSEGIEGMHRLETMGQRLLAAQLSLICIAALIIFFPLIRRLRYELRERAIAQSQLLEQNSELELFSATVAHDLKAPLNSIGGFSQFLRSKLLNKEDQSTNEILERIESGVKRMTLMIDELLQYARLTRSGRRIERVPLADVLAKVRLDFEQRLIDQGGTLKVDPLPVVTGDRVQFEHLFHNLISNAIKYRDAERVPMVTVKRLQEREEPGRVMIAVEDNGRGFPAASEQRMFEPFRRLNPGEQIEGSGFGLALCKKIVMRHNGSIFAERVATGGARFVVSLPERR